MARLEDQKDHLTLLNALLDLKKTLKFKLLIIGNGKMKKIKHLIQMHDLDKNVKLIKDITNPFPYILQADFFILTSIYEGLPTVLLEAITLKKYVISSDCPTGPKEILENGKNGTLFKFGNSNDLRNKIRKINSDKKKNKKKISLAYRSLSRFNDKKNLHKYFNLLNKYLI